MKELIVRYKNYIWALMLIALLVGCKDRFEEFEELEECRPSDFVLFTGKFNNDVQAEVTRGICSYLSIEEEEWTLTAREQSAATRGSVVDSLNGLNVGVYGYTIATDTKTEVFDNTPFEFVDKEDLLPKDNKPKTWNSLTGSSLKVFTYAPKMELSDWDPSEGEPKIDYSVDADITKQQDLIASDVKTVPVDYNQYIPLTFKHVLTGVRFKVGFGCTVKSLKVIGVYGKGTYELGNTWSDQKNTTTFNVITNGSASYAEGAMLPDASTTLFMIPQLLPEGAKVVLEYDGGTREASLAGLKWEPGKLITYTINEEEVTPEYIYFDLNAGNVTINNTSYSGYIFVNGVATEVSGSGVNISTLKFYVYQSTEANKATTGWETRIGVGVCRVPKYEPVKVGNKFWSEFITNNTDVNAVIAAWDNEQGAGKGQERREQNDLVEPNQPGAAGAVRNVGREATKHRIHVSGTTGDVDLTIDNIYSSFQQKNSNSASEHIVRTRSQGGISFLPSEMSGSNSTLTINILGDNRVGCVNYQNNKPEINCLVFQGTGSLTVADVDYFRDSSGLGSNRSCSVIGGKDSNENEDDVYNIVFNSGVIYAGATTSSCTAIGGGGNGYTKITINGGSITAVASTTGTAIGGGTGLVYPGGEGYVTITGGNVYAYNYKNSSNIPSSAIGGAGSRDKSGALGTINITNGYVYAFSESGTAIGGGSSSKMEGGGADVTITGGYVVALSDTSTCIGGGLGGTSKASDGKTPAYGGSATIKISGNPTIRTGSIGGGKTNNPNGKIGSATINVSGGDILGQFVMAGGAGEGQTSSFTMTGGTISNSNVDDNEYYHVQKKGGAVYMEDGTFIMEGGTIKNCKADVGGAVYIKKSANALKSPEFTMSGGTIKDCTSDTHGGAIYLEVGTVTLSGNATINSNLAKSGNGGAIYVTAGDFIMENGTVAYNSALGKGHHSDGSVGNGGGIYVTTNNAAVNVTVLEGTIEHNTSDGNGGGLCVDMPDTISTANIKIGEENSSSLVNPSIQRNQSVMYGGGLYARGKKAQISINGGTIMNNSVSNYVPNENVYNEQGTVTLNGGNVTHVVVTFDANPPKDTTPLLDGQPTVTQKIVTNTNSFLVGPANITLPSAHNFKGWNTRPDGKGKDYKKNDIMNLKEDLTLYAIWEFQGSIGSGN